MHGNIGHIKMIIGIKIPWSSCTTV